MDVSSRTDGRIALYCTAELSSVGRLSGRTPVAETLPQSPPVCRRPGVRFGRTVDGLLLV